MAQNRMMHQALLEQLQGADTDVLRRVLEHAMQRLIEAEAATQIGAGPHERASTRTTYRNGYRERILDTGSGRLELQIPKLRSGSFFPTLLEPRRRIDRALLAVVQEAYVLGHQHPQGRRPHGRTGRLQHQSQRGEPDLRAPRRRARRVP